MSRDVDAKSFASEVLESKVPVLVDFWAPWCGPCRLMGPVVDELSKEFEGRAKVVKLNVDDAPEIAAKFGISAIPSLLVFRDENPTKRFVGVVSKSQISLAIQKELAA